MLDSITAGRFRLFLALVVMFHHSLGFFGFGAVAVYLFFVLSGYWIANIWDNKYSFNLTEGLRFYASRWCRLFPLLFGVLLLVFLLSRYIPSLDRIYGTGSMQSPKWWLNVISIVNIGHQYNPLPVVWSLDVEAQFYLAAPFIGTAIVILRPGFWVKWIVPGIAFIAGVSMFTAGVISTSCNLFVFLFFFLVGMVHYHSKTIPRKTLVMAGIIVFLLLVGGVALHPEYRNLLTNYSIHRSPDMQRIQNIFMYAASVALLPVALHSVHQKSSAVDRQVGDLAYPLYLFHLIPIRFYYSMEFPDAARKMMGLGCAWLACIGGSILLYWVIDRPCEHLRRYKLKL